MSLEKGTVAAGKVIEEKVVEKPEIEEEQLELESSNEEEEDSDESSEDEGKSPKPLWLAEDDDEEEEEQAASDTVPEASLIKIKQKLKGRIKDGNEENERLKARIKELESGVTQKSIVAPKRPRLADFDNDNKYEEAMDIYEEAKLKYQQVVLTSSTNDSERVKKHVQKINQAVDDHHTRAAKLIETNGLSPEVYKQAEETVQSMIEEIHPKQSESIYANLVNIIGEGSEKTLFFVGRNKTAKAEFKQALLEDKTGLQAAFYLGQKANEIQGNKKQTSRARKPAPQLKGAAVTKEKGSALKKKYIEAHKKGSSQVAYNLKKQARTQGVDVTSWR